MLFESDISRGFAILEPLTPHVIAALANKLLPVVDIRSLQLRERSRHFVFPLFERHVLLRYLCCLRSRFSFAFGYF